jgi:NhaA family Na+:H+ antiporter
MILTKIYKDFFDSEKAGGFALIVCTIFSLILSNSGLANEYINLWCFQIGQHPVEYWINDGLMTFFFLLIGLELVREIYFGELNNLKNAILPIFAAFGGMIIPAGFYLILNIGSITQSGAGIPMATDIAFAVGILSLLGNHVPISLKVFLTALAVIDDLGAIIVIALFYSKSVIIVNLFIALGIYTLLFILNRLKVKNLTPYIIGGIAMWFFMLNSGIHPTITGVLLAFVIPFGNDNEKSPSFVLQRFLHKPVSFIILPLFALANTAIMLHSGWHTALVHNYTMGIGIGLLFGKPIGIFLFSFLTVKLKLGKLPLDLNWNNILGVSFLGGIGFTMSIFITLLAYSDFQQIENAKIMILLSSFIAGTIGFIFLKSTLKNHNN